MSAGTVAAEGTTGRPKWVRPAGYFLGLALFAAAAALILSIHTTADVQFDCTCDSLTVPVERLWPIPDYVGAVHARGFSADVQPITGATVTTGAGTDKKDLPLQVSQLVLVTNPERAKAFPSLDLRPSGKRGVDSYLRLPAGATVRGGEVADSWGPCVALDIPPSDGVIVHLRSDGAHLPEVNRMSAQMEATPDWLRRAETFAVALVPTDRQFVTTDLSEVADVADIDKDKRTVTLRFEMGKARAELFVASELSDQDQIPSGRLTVKSCTNGHLLIDGRAVEEPLLQASADASFEAKVLRLKSIEVVQHPAAGAKTWALKATLTGKAASVRLGEKELAPTLWDDILHGSTRVRLLAGFVGAVALLGLIYLSLLVLGVFFVKNVTITATNVTYAEHMKDVTITVTQHLDTTEKKLAASSASDEVKQLIAQLTAQLKKVMEELPQAKAATHGSAQSDGENVKAMAEKIKDLSEAPPKEVAETKWYELSLTGLKEAALAVGEIAKPIVDTVIKLAPLLGVKLPG